MSYMADCARWFAIGGAALGLVLAAALTVAKWMEEGDGFGFLSFFPSFVYLGVAVLVLAIEGLIAGAIVGLLLEVVDLVGTEVHRLFHWLAH